MSGNRKLCLVAGVGPGVGLAVAKAFASAGYDVAMMARRADALAEYGADIAALGGSAIPLPADLTDFGTVSAAWARLTAAHGTPDVVIYNAGRWVDRHPAEWSVDAFMGEMALCVGAAHHLVTLAHGGMKARGAGAFLFTGGGLALFPQYGPTVVPLTAGKAALRGYALALAEALKPDGLQVGLVTIAGQVAPGTAFDPDKIAQRFVAHARQHADAWVTETVFDGKG